MSSTEFFCDLDPCRRLRRWPLASAALALLIGCVLISRLPLPLPLRAVAAVLWVYLCCRELGQYSRAMFRVRGIRLYSNGRVVLRLVDGRRVDAELAAGTLVLRRLAWLVVQVPGEMHYGEFLAGGPANDRQWHRLQLIWRQRRHAFGRQGHS